MEQQLGDARAVIGDPLLVAAGRQTGSDEAVVEALFRQHRAPLTNLAAAITLDRALAEEVVQEAFAELHVRIGHVDVPLAYVRRSVVQRSISVVRRRKVAARYAYPVATPTVTPEIDETWSAVVRLPPRERAVVVLRYWDDLSEAAIASALGWPNGTVKSTLHRAVKRLRQELQQ